GRSTARGHRTSPPKAVPRAPESPVAPPGRENRVAAARCRLAVSRSRRKPPHEQSRRSAPVANLVLLVRRERCHRHISAGAGVGNEDRVVAKSAASARLVSQPAFAAAFEEPFLSVRRSERECTHVSRTPVFCAFGLGE